MAAVAAEAGMMKPVSVKPRPEEMFGLKTRARRGGDMCGGGRT